MFFANGKRLQQRYKKTTTSVECTFLWRKKLLIDFAAKENSEIMWVFLDINHIWNTSLVDM